MYIPDLDWPSFNVLSCYSGSLLMKAVKPSKREVRFSECRFLSLGDACTILHDLKQSGDEGEEFCSLEL